MITILSKDCSKQNSIEAEALGEVRESAVQQGHLAGVKGVTWNLAWYV